MKSARTGYATAQRDSLRVDEGDDIRKPEREIFGEVLPGGDRVPVACLRGLSDLLRAELVARDVEQRAFRKRRGKREGVSDQSRSRRLRLKAADLAAGTNEAVGRPNLVVSDLARAEIIAEQQLASRYDPAADSRPEGEQDEVFRADAVPEEYSPRVAQRESFAMKTGTSKRFASVGPSGAFSQPRFGL